MRVWMGSLLLLALTWSSVAAQPRFRRAMPDSAQILKMVDELAAAVKLDSVQKAEVQKIYFKSFADLKAAMEKHRGNFRAMAGERRKIMDDRREAVRALLNAEQKKKYDAWLKKMDEERRNRWRRMRQTP